MKPLTAGSPGGAAAPPGRATLRGHLAILRVDHWFKNVFVLPGIVAAAGIERDAIAPALAARIAAGLASFCLVASSNYVLNEVLDAGSDRCHPTKRTRPVPSGLVSIPLAYAQWLALMIAGVGAGLLVSLPFAATVFALWLMGCVYNAPPVRTKDLPYVDVLSEAINNPLRLLGGWFITATHSVAPLSLLLSYWMAGGYFMALKRFAEYRDIGDPARAAAYRRSFAYYTPERLLVSVMFYAALAMLFLGAFIMRYRFELILAFPFVALVLALYLALSFQNDSAVQRPEGLWREPGLMAAVVLCAGVMTVLLYVDLPFLQPLFSPTASTHAGGR